ncbi:hypothetical protein CATMIT_01916, partial [Catenibacterium mitsuokai DSM 15897]
DAAGGDRQRRRGGAFAHLVGGEDHDLAAVGETEQAALVQILLQHRPLGRIDVDGRVRAGFARQIEAEDVGAFGREEAQRQHVAAPDRRGFEREHAGRQRRDPVRARAVGQGRGAEVDRIARGRPLGLEALHREVEVQRLFVGDVRQRGVVVAVGQEQLAEHAVAGVEV